MQSSVHPASMRDVARLAGVSHQTVSRVLNNHPSLRESTRQRVLAAIDELQYRPNRAARTLATSKSRLIGLLVAEAGSYFGPNSSIRAIQDAARDAGYAVTTANLESTVEEQIVHTLDQLLAQAVEGIVVISPQTCVLDAVAAHAPTVPFVTMQASEEGSSGILWREQFGAARQATRYLVRLGHARIAHVSGPRAWMEAEARLAGYRAEMEAHSLVAAEPVVGDWTPDSGYLAGRHLLGHHPTAVFCSNDQMALGVMHALHDAGVRVPGEVSVIGFDDIPEAAHFLPPLTTMRQDFTRLGQRSLAALIGAIERSGSGAAPAGIVDIASSLEPGEPVTVEPQLVVRASTAPPQSL